MASSNAYIIATAIDRAFVEPACVLLASIVANADVPEASLLVYGLGLTLRDRDRLAKSVARVRGREAAAHCPRNGPRLEHPTLLAPEHHYRAPSVCATKLIRARTDSAGSTTK